MVPARQPRTAESTVRALPPDQFYRLAPLFDPEGYNSPMLFSVLEGRNPGRAWADVPDRPTRALVHTGFGMVFVAPHDADATLAELLPALAGGEPLHLVWQPDAPLPRSAAELGARAIDRLEFRDRTTVDCPPLPVDMALVPLAAELLDRCIWREQVQRAVGVGAALRPGLGLCLLHGSTIAVEAYALFWGAGQVEVGVVTHPDYRRRGLGLLACANLLDQCEAQDARTVWSCHVGNPASAALARRLGFRTERRYQLILLAK